MDKEEKDIEIELDTVESLKEKLKKALEERQEYLTGWQRAKADLINARKRDEESQKDFIKYANEGLISELLSVLDSFHMAMANKDAWEKADKNWRTGVEYIANQFKKVLEDNGLKEIDPLGKDFDPMRDEALEHVIVDNEKDVNKIIEVVQKGYELNGKVLKASKVKIGELKK